MPTPLSARLNRDRDNVVGSSGSVSAYTTPMRSKSPFRTNSSRASTSYTPTVISSGQGQQKLNVVTRVAIEGRAKQGQDGAAMKMYLKIAVPLESVSPGMTVPLFPEENVKILSSQIHPLDNNSVPYNFSSTLSPLLHNAARALNLPARSSETFDSVIHSSSVSSPAPPSVRSSLSTNGSPSPASEEILPVDEQYTGHILVSGYNVSFVLPRVFPSRKGFPSDGEADPISGSAYRRRRPSIGDRNLAHFMAAIDMWIPYVSRPPRHPYLLSVPTPRCLHNNIRLRIFPPSTTSASLASLSSVEDDSGTWDLTSEPHVTRTSLRARSNSYTHFADDESSDSSTTGFPDGCGIQGTFPSAEHIRIRWAKPLRSVDIPGGDDGRRRAGVRDVKGEMTCVVKGKAKHKERPGATGIIMDLEYKASCKGIWFPGVATLLGMDVGLETKGSDVFWVDGHSNEWEITGGNGFTGFYVGSSKSPRGLQRAGSVDSNGPHLEDSPGPPSEFLTRTDSTSSSNSSLLRAPLPGQGDVEYSFEGSNANSISSTTGTVSTISSLDPSSSNDLTPSTPGQPITIHLNLNDIVSPSKNTFQFTISGTVLVIPRPNASRLNRSGIDDDLVNQKELETDPISLPRFSVLAADTEHTSMDVCNDVNGIPLPLDVYTGTNDGKTVLQKGGAMKCPQTGTKVALRFPNTTMNGRVPASPNRSQSPEPGSLSRRPSMSSPHRLFTSRLRQESPLMLPTVQATITPLVQTDKPATNGYVIRLCLTTPVNPESEYLEFGLGRAGDKEPGRNKPSDKPPKVDIVGATVGGIPVKCDATHAAQPELSIHGVPFEKMDSNEWLVWVRVPVGTTGGEAAIVDYVVLDDERSNAAKPRKSPLDILLPSFHLPVGRFEVIMEGVKASSVKSNFAHMLATENKCKIFIFSVERFFYPTLSVVMSPETARRTSWTTYGSITLLMLSFVLFLWTSVITSRLADRLGDNLERHVTVASDTIPQELVEPITVTTTVFINTGTQTWREEKTVTEPTATASCPTSTSTSETKPTSAHVPSTAPEPEETVVDPTPDPHDLLPMQHAFSFHFPSFSAEDWEETYENLRQTMDKVWQVLRQVYHYPLDPP